MMIVYDLVCALEHRFEGWFPSAEEFASQKARGLLTCPVCGDGHIERLPSAPHVSSDVGDRTASHPQTSEARSQRGPTPAQVLAWLLRNCEDVGDRFPEEARRIYYGEAPERSIRGTANREEAEALVEEGIPVVQLPIPNPSDWH